MKLSTYKSDQTCRLFSFKPKNSLIFFDEVRDLEGYRDTARHCRTYPRGTTATITYAAGYTSTRSC